MSDQENIENAEKTKKTKKTEKREQIKSKRQNRDIENESKLLKPNKKQKTNEVTSNKEIANKPQKEEKSATKKINTEMKTHKEKENNKEDKQTNKDKQKTKPKKVNKKDKDKAKENEKKKKNKANKEAIEKKESWPVLYHLDSNDRVRYWSIKVEKDAVVVVCGLEDGKKIETITKCEGKNLGRANETTPNQQAKLEAESKWVKQVRKGYGESKSVGRLVYPMLAQTWQGMQNNIKTKGKTNARISNLKNKKGSKTDEEKQNHKQDHKQNHKQMQNECEEQKQRQQQHQQQREQDQNQKQEQEQNQKQKQEQEQEQEQELVYVQPKLDGYRCLVYIDPRNGNILKMSRTNKKIETVDHIDTEWELVLKQLGPGAVLDGELYEHTKRFEELSSMIKKPKNGYQVQHHVYDFYVSPGLFQLYNELNQANSGIKDVKGGITPMLNAKTDSKKNTTVFKTQDSKQEEKNMKILCKMSFDKRICRLQQVFNVYGKAFKHLRLVETHKVLPYTETNIQERFSKYIAQKYEGMMIRRGDSPYEPNKRSKNLQKLKKRDDAEYLVVDAAEAKGSQEGCVVWRVQDPQNPKIIFDVVPRASLAEKRKLYIERNKYIGKGMLRVLFHGKTDDGIPRFPVGDCFRASFDL